MADVKILTETGQGLISGHDGLLSWAERKKGVASFLTHPPHFLNVCDVFLAGHQLFNDR
jgi:hypothetical protein